MSRLIHHSATFLLPILFPINEAKRQRESFEVCNVMEQKKRSKEIKSEKIKVECSDLRTIFGP
ncbi:CLUMA_CG020797, isoform A [Clunio marinus]|uniref:CLUMA_CG020797, isoform A n=1 Tax=Clunio marinus TaxID=568069 RepID=A0A1J1J611_9DIPT|nr:CLUMA_CG020797, isoform A [Clunio marinus]